MHLVCTLHVRASLTLKCSSYILEGRKGKNDKHILVILVYLFFAEHHFNLK